MKKPSKIVWGYIALSVFTFTPVLAAFMVDVLAQTYHCKLTDGSIPPCITPGGHDISELISFCMVMAWMMLVSVPTGFFGFIIYTAIILVVRKKAKNAKSAYP